ncbi:methyltransferase family protein [Actinoplanes sp. NPDC051513]|uniref:methyltransferase family protein n=1 Tax=Actinoplanes sp. NPDC051513 TaxID=3363908 RepID=UPI0037A4D9BF
MGVGGTFGCLLPYLLGYWRVQRPLPYWGIAQTAGAGLICLGLAPIVHAFVEFVRAGGTPVPVASPPRLVVSGLYRYVRNPIYVGFLVVLTGQALVFGSAGMVVYAVVSWCVAATAVRFYEQPRLARRFGANYERYVRAVPAWIPRLHRVNPAARPPQSPRDPP